MAKFGITLIATFSVIALWSIYASAGPIGDRSTTPITTTVLGTEENATVILATTTTEVIPVTKNETGIIDTLTTEIDVAGGNETHIRQKRSCGCCCCRPCCCCCRPCCCCCRCCCCRCCCCCCRCCCCRCCCCRPCCCCGGCGCCGCGGGRKRRAIQQLSHKLMDKHIAEFNLQQQQFDSAETDIDQVEALNIATTTSIASTTTPEATSMERTETTTSLSALQKMTNAKIDSFGRRQY